MSDKVRIATAVVMAYIIIFLSWITPLTIEAFAQELRQECLDSYINFSYIELQTGNVTHSRALQFGSWYFDNCFDFKYSDKEFFDRVNELTQEIQNNERVSQK